MREIQAELLTSTVAQMCIRANYDLPRDVLRRISSRITNEVRGINRVVYDITSKPPATVELE